MKKVSSSSSDEEEGGFLKRSRETSASTPEPTTQKRARSTTKSKGPGRANGRLKNEATRQRPTRKTSRTIVIDDSDDSDDNYSEDSGSEFAGESEDTSGDENLEISIGNRGNHHQIVESDDEIEELAQIIDVRPANRGTTTSRTPKRRRARVEEDDDVEILDEHQVEEVADEEAVEQPRQERRPRRQPRRAQRANDGVPRHEVIFNRMNEKLFEFHPDLKDVFDVIKSSPVRKPVMAEQPKNIVTPLLPFQKEGLHWLLDQEQSKFHGGILADEMGMGKTIQTVALFASDPPDAKQTLVVTPTVALVQWKNEILKHTGNALSVCVYHGQARNKKAKAGTKKEDGTVGLEEANIILTTYAVLESVYRKQQSGFKRNGSMVREKSVLHNLEFHRVVLDEAHSVKDRQSSTARSVFNIKAKYRLCLSGTPLQNRIGEIYSLLRFLQVKPFCEYFCYKCECRSTSWQFTSSNRCDACGHVGMQHLNFFNHSLLKRIQRYGYQGAGAEALSNLRALLGQIMLRRTKIERADDLGLPPRVVQVRRDFFNEEEKDLYASVYSDSNRRFNTYVNQGVVLNNYANIFTLITRMRQIADHPDLVLRRAEGAGISHGAAVDKDVCGICDDIAEDAIESKCHHVFCRLCIKEYIEGWTGNENDLECPICHVGLTIDLTAPGKEVSTPVAMSKSASKSIVNRIDMDNWRSSTKIEALVEELYKLRSENQTIKSIVFSQFTSMLDLVEWRLKKAGFQTVKLQGSMSPAQRDGIIRHFMENHSVEIFLVSLKAGGVALNLCEASQVFILDPWWNPSVEWQSGDRVHRIGQHRPVRITRMVIEDSIESRIIELQEKKANMIHATIGHDDAAMNKLTPADMQFLFMN